ncbi:aminotransferase class I/II-fold pyridoxal phosphate-dependent enzyme [Rhodobium gokarnense]|uniref:dTDP-4-amino-4,6-dideoxygalactose transaminase n=1 Tax=Rhodobium gokarnense TaxID=364296 RepID=A0ABT3HE08_9HYPH|nr:aminotransferase class I/II-fold pyridoxal phosphate-dependent enzyme [Rhodobium gokarnense]MCW2308634.1 dTDP-4-amino-4,6-dideoxygalactose transaminase [Rhodobium gokarnense]
MFKKVVWLAGMPRSGTNWASQIFASHPDVRLKFCPLFSYPFKNACDENSTADDWNKLFEAVYTTSDAYLDQEYLRKDGLLPTFEEKSDAPSVLCIKSTRYHHLLPNLLDLVPELHLVVLVRNPAASIHSWLTNPHEFPDGADPATEWRSGACRKTGTGEFWGFDDWKAVTRQQLALARARPDRVTVVVYEDLVRDAGGETARLFDRLGLDLHPQTSAFLTASQSSNKSHKRAVFKDPNVSERWTGEIDPEIRYTIGRELVGTPLARFCDARTLAVGAGWRGPKGPLRLGPTKAKLDDLAAFGGPPLFDRTQPRPIGQLAKPSSTAFSRYVDTIYEERRWSNNGALVRTLEHRLAEYHGVEHCVTFANASLAIVALLKSVALPTAREIILPAFTYVGLPHIIVWSGYQPRFCDIDERTQSLSPSAVEAAVTEETAAILAVHQVNAPCDHEWFADFSSRTGVPVVYDSVHALGCSLPDGTPIGGLGEAEVFSLHATKILNGFEGGYITTNNPDLAHTLKSLRNFGYTTEISTDAIGLNGKLNEVHAAMALASLEQVDTVIAENEERFLKYRNAFHDIEGLSFVPYEDSYKAKNYEFALLEIDENWPLERDTIVSLLRAENALARAYYNEPLYRYDDYPEVGSCSAPNVPRNVVMPFMPVTDKLARRIIQMPVGGHVATTDIEGLADFFRFVRENAQDIRMRLQARTES